MIRSGDFVKLKDRPIGYFMPLDIKFQVQYLTDNGKRAYITNNGMALDISVELLVLLDDKGEKVMDKKENNIVCYTGEKIKIKNEFGAVIEFGKYLGQLKRIHVELFGDDKCYDKCYGRFIFEKISELNNFIRILGFKQVIKRAETVDEIIEEMKNKVVLYTPETKNWYVVIDYRNKKVYKNFNDGYNNLGTLYFNKEVADDFVKRLQVAYEREGWK